MPETDKEKPVIPLNEAHWHISVRKGILHQSHWYWKAHTTDNVGLDTRMFIGSDVHGGHTKPEQAEQDAEAFMDNNGWNNYTISRQN